MTTIADKMGHMDRDYGFYYCFTEMNMTVTVNRDVFTQLFLFCLSVFVFYTSVQTTDNAMTISYNQQNIKSTTTL